MSDKPLVPERWRASYESGSSHSLCIHHKKQVIEELGAAEAALAEALQERKSYLEEIRIVRDRLRIANEENARLREVSR